MDKFLPEERSKLMSNIKGINTQPELLVRKILHKLGFRFRLHCKKLPGRPDIILPRYKTIIFVNGCFWHLHTCKKGKRLPKSNLSFWKNKLTQNKLRDRKNKKKLEVLGWRILTIWECETKKLTQLKTFILRKLEKKWIMVS